MRLSSCLPALLLLLATAGCAGSTPAPSPAGDDHRDDAERTRYRQRVSPFAVTDADGQALDVPFLGGLDVPRPQIVDVNGDGASDLFLQETTGRLLFFENVAGEGAPAEWAWRSSHYRSLDVGEWYRFVDLSGDGVVDLLAEEPYSYLRYFHNTGTAEAPQFVLAEDTLRTVEGEPLFSDRQNIPNVADLDCDDRPDLLVGRLDGTITHYEASGPASSAGVPRFRLVTKNFENIKIVGDGAAPGRMPGSRQMPGPNPAHVAPTSQDAKHGANTMAFADVDGDGDSDLLWGDYFEEGLLLLENRGGCERVDFSNDPRPFPSENPLANSGYNAPTAGDLTGDGRRDLLVGVIGGAFDPSRDASANLYFYEKTGRSGYALRTRQYLSMIDAGSESAVATGDLTGDGAPELVVGSKASGGALLWYRNEGTPQAPRLRRADTLSLAGEAYNRAPALVDLDADGDLDLAVGTWQQGIVWHENTGTARQPQFAAEAQPLASLERGSRLSPAFADFDADGDLDLVVGESDGELSFLRNTGTPGAPQFERDERLLAGAEADRRSAPAAHDIDGDGDVDLVAGTEAAGLVFFRNTGTPEAPQFERTEMPALAVDAPGLLTPAFADMDADGDADLLGGTGRGGVVFFEDRR